MNAPVTTNNLDAFWMPFTANRQFKKNPRMFVGADRMHYTTSDGRQVLDGTAGLWCVNAGHNRPRIVEAIQKQAAELDYAPAFQMGHHKAFELASKLVQLTPPGLDHVMYTNSGSESVETALKTAIAYHRVKGDGSRFRLIGRERGYHGVNFGGISVGGIVPNRKMFGTLLTGVDHMRHTHDLARNAFTREVPEHGVELADDLERIVALHDASTIAAVIVEPVAKGLTNGVIPMGAVFVTNEIHDAFMNGPEHMIEFFHGYTYSGNPMACATALATLETYREEGLLTRGAELSSYWEDALHSLKGLPHVIDVRNIGLIGAIELEPIAGEPTKRAFAAFLDAYDKGLLIRTTGDIIALSPPLIIEKQEIDFIVDKLRDVLTSLN